MGDDPTATWKSKTKRHPENNHVKDMNRIDGMPTELEWKIFSGITTFGLFEKIQSQMRDLQWELENLMTGSSSCQCTTSLNGTDKEQKKDVNTTHRQLRIMLVNSFAVIGLCWDLDQKRNSTGLTLADPTDLGKKLQNRR